MSESITIREKKLSEHSAEETSRLSEYLSVWVNRVENPNNEWKEPTAYKVKAVTDKSDPLTVVHYSYRNNITDKEVWLLVGLDLNNKIVGMRQTYFNAGDENTEVADGNIEVFRRGKGVASALEAVHVELLLNKLKSDTNIKQINHTIDDANSRRLQDTKSNLEVALNKGDLNEANRLQNSLDDANRQRNSWEKLYGVGGRFGVTLQDGQPVRAFTRESGNPFANKYVISETNIKINLADSLKAAAKDIAS